MTTTRLETVVKPREAGPLRQFYRYRHVLFVTSLNEIRSKYRGTVFGLAWAVLYPFLFLTVYASVYAFILKIKFANLTPNEFVLLIFSGEVPFIGFAEVLTVTVFSVVANKHLIRNTLFPIELLPVKAVIASSVSMTVGLVSLVIGLWLVGRIYWSQFAIIPIFLMQIVFSIGVAWLLSAANVFIRDLSHVMGIVVLFLMIASPIGYTHDMIPHKLLPIMLINPLYYFIEAYRQAMIYNSVPFVLLGVIAAFSIITFYLGFTLFTRLKPVFSDYL